MDRYSYQSEMRKIANFRANDREIHYIGHLIGLKLGGKDLKQDFSFKDPTAPATEVPMAAALTDFRWTGLEGDPVRLIGRVTDGNSSFLAEALEDNSKTRDCEFHLNVYKHKEGTTFFKTLHTDGAFIKGTLVLANCYLGSFPVGDYTQIKNYEFELLIEGARGITQAILSDRGADVKRAIQFGNPSPVA